MNDRYRNKGRLVFVSGQDSQWGARIQTGVWWYSTHTSIEIDENI